MNRKRLYRSSDAVISGVCGGIAEYFGIDPTLVRIIAVALTVVGLGFPAIIYVILMIVLPPDPGIAQGYVDTRAETTETHCERIYSSAASNSTSATSTSATIPEPVDVTVSASPASQPPPPDPATRVFAPRAATANSAPRATTANSAPRAATANSAPRAASVAATARNHSSAILVVGAILIGVGIITLLCNFIHISVWRFWPIVIIVVGVVCLFTPGHRGWSLERAGNSIVLITVGLAILAWMLQIIQTRVFIEAFSALWPVLLVVAGLAIIGSARKSSTLSLISSLVLSATILLGLWFYGGLDWSSLGTVPFVIDTDGIHEFLSDLPFVGE